LLYEEVSVPLCFQPNDHPNAPSIVDEQRRKPSMNDVDKQSAKVADYQAKFTG
jgi:hypothetical protein